jgi:hypothetical protein
MVGTYTYTNNLGIVKRLSIIKRKKEYRWICFEMNNGECCFCQDLNEKQSKETLLKFQNSYSNFTKIA